MIEYYRKIGLRMYRIRYVLMALIIALSLVTGRLLFAGPDTSERFLLPSMVLTTWFVLCLSLGYFFAGMKDEPGENAGLLERIGHSIRKAFTYVLAVFFTVVSLLLLYFTTTAIRLAATA